MFVCLCVLLPAPWPCNGDSATTTQTLQANVAANGKLAVASSVALTTSSTIFADYTGSLAVSYRVRTTAGSGNGTITVSASSDFSPVGGPSVGAGNLTYTCGSASIGSGCSGTQTVSTGTQTPVAAIGAGACTGGGTPCSNSDPNTVQLNFRLVNSPSYPTGAYSAQVIFTISAT